MSPNQKAAVIVRHRSLHGLLTSVFYNDRSRLIRETEWMSTPHNLNSEVRATVGGTFFLYSLKCNNVEGVTSDCTKKQLQKSKKNQYMKCMHKVEKCEL